MKIVIVRLDLDRYDLITVERLLIDQIITLEEACESKWVRAMNDLERLTWIRQVQKMRVVGQKRAS